MSARSEPPPVPPRLLLVDDSPAIHADFAKTLAPTTPDAAPLERAESALFGEPGRQARREPTRPRFEVASASSGREALEQVRRALDEQRPFAVAFVDVRMPGGWDGVRTVQELWRVDPDLQVVLCTAYRERTWEDVLRRLGSGDRLLLLKKPFDGFEVLQLASALAHKALLGRAARCERSELERQVAERTAELSAANAALTERMHALERAESEARAAAEHLREAHEELEEAHAQAQTATLAKSEFLANMSHEIRTPMTAILGYADLLRDADLSHAERLEHLKVITRSGKHLLSILGDILDWSTLESGRMRIRRAPCSPGTLLAGIGSQMRLRAGAKGLALEIEFVGPVPASVRTDATRLRQVLTHLVTNAIKFTERGEVRVGVRLEPARAGGEPMLCFEVADSGVGLTREQIQVLFRPFQQLDGSATRRHGGAGLGLAIARRLAERLGGGLSVESEPGRGSRFTVRVATGPLEGVPMLHALGEALVVGEQLELAQEPPRDPGTQLAGRSVLLAEDGRDNQLLLSFYLRKAGADVKVASDGGEALRLAVAAAARGKPFHVIVSDMQMPVLDGYELARRLRDDGYRSPIVALTAHALPGDREKCLEAGCNDYLTKPVDRERLIAVCAQQAASGSGLGNTTIQPPLTENGANPGPLSFPRAPLPGAARSELGAPDPARLRRRDDERRA